MSTPFRYCAGLLVAWSCLSFHSDAHAQRPAMRNPRELMPRERQFLELDVDLGKPAPFPSAMALTSRSVRRLSVSCECSMPSIGPETTVTPVRSLLARTGLSQIRLQPLYPLLIKLLF